MFIAGFKVVVVVVYFIVIIQDSTRAPSQKSFEAVCLCLLTDTSVSHRLANANSVSAAGGAVGAGYIAVSPVIAVTK